MLTWVLRSLLSRACWGAMCRGGEVTQAGARRVAGGREGRWDGMGSGAGLGMGADGWGGRDLGW